MHEKWFTETGALTDFAKMNVDGVSRALESVLYNSSYLSEQELLMLGATLQSTVANAISNRIAEEKKKQARKENNPLFKMSDDEFRVYMDEYFHGENLFKKQMSENEQERYLAFLNSTGFIDELRAKLNEIESDYNFYHSYHSISPTDLGPYRSA
jgi:hypothetical protein